MKLILPSYYDIDQSALDTMALCVQEFSSSISCEALTMAGIEGKRKLGGDDIVQSLDVLGFDNFVNPLRSYLAKRETHIQSCEQCAKYPVVAIPVMAPDPKNGVPEATDSEPPSKKTKTNKSTTKPSISDPSTAEAAEPSESLESADQKQKKKNVRINWTDPSRMKEFVKVITEASQQCADQQEIIKRVSKELKLPIKVVKEKLEE
jgi:hypothetical protein